MRRVHHIAECYLVDMGEDKELRPQVRPTGGRIGLHFWCTRPVGYPKRPIVGVSLCWRGSRGMRPTEMKGVLSRAVGGSHQGAT